MDKEINNKEDNNQRDVEAPEVEPSQETPKFKFMNQEFDYTPDGYKQFEAAKNVFEQTLGRQSQELGTLRKELPHVKKLGSSVDSPSRAQLFKQVSDMLEEGDTEKSVKLMADYIVQMEEQKAKKDVENSFRQQYEQARPDYFDVLDKDLAWDHVFNNYRDELYHQDDPVAFVDSVLGPKVEKLKSRFKPMKELDDSNSFEPLGTNKAAPKKAAPSAAADKPKGKTLRDLADSY